MRKVVGPDVDQNAFLGEGRGVEPSRHKRVVAHQTIDLVPEECGIHGCHHGGTVVVGVGSRSAGDKRGESSDLGEHFCLLEGREKRMGKERENKGIGFLIIFWCSD
jgi:hypothetical protein